MEQYNNNQDLNVKEKNVYLLHLDGPRILILSAIIIGLLSVSFLIGMKIMGDKPEDSLTQNDQLSEQQGAAAQVETLDPIKSPLPDLQAPTAAATQPPTAMQDSVIPQTSSQHASKKSESDLLASSAIHEPASAIQPSSKGGAKTVNTTKVSSKKTAHKKSKVAKADKDSVVEVSYSKQNESKKLIHGYFVQLASFDKIEKAKSEVQKLKTMDYDAFWDKKDIKGKNFFRVRIGPIATKDKALFILDEVQQNPRYEESFVIHE